MVAKLKRIAALLLALALVCSAIPSVSGMVVQAEEYDSVTEQENETETDTEAEEEAAEEAEVDSEAEAQETADENFITPETAGLIDDADEEEESQQLKTVAASLENHITTGGNVVVASDTQWKYLDNNTDPAVGTMIYENYGMNYGWAYGGYYFYQDQFFPVDDYAYDDSSWSAGYGPFSYDEDGNGTGLAQTDSDENDVPAYFFRATFDLTEEQLENINSAYYEFLYKDAAIFYVNGRSINQDFNTPVKGYAQNLSYGADSEGDEYHKAGGQISAEYLLAGTNTIAVEIHRADANSSAYFDFLSLVLSEEEEAVIVEDIKAMNVSVGSDETELGFTWYSSAADAAEIRISADKNVFVSHEVVTEPADTADGYYVNKATIKNLKANTTYYYKVGSGTTWSELYEIKTGDGSSFSFLLAGDPQIGASGNIRSDNYGWKQMIQKAKSSFPEVSFLVSAGDQVETANNEDHYDSYLIEELLNLPVATTIGNHDNTANYSEHFNVPNESTLGGSSAGGDYWYTYGDALFMMINAQNTSAAEHQEFMEAAIAANPDVNWTIAVFHQSVYSAASHSKTQVILDWREVMVPVIDELEIDIVLMGHDHSYTRTYQMYGNEVAEELTETGEQVSGGKAVDPEGTLYVTANSASGSKFYGLQDEYEYQALRHQSEQATITKIDMTADTFEMKTYILDDQDDLVILDEYAITKTAAGEQGTENKDEEEPVKTPGNTDDGDATVTKTDTTDKTASTTNPKTGDENSFFVWMLLMAGVGCVMMGTIVYKKKTRAV